MNWQDVVRKHNIPVWPGAHVRERDDTAAGIVLNVRGDRLDVWVNGFHVEADDGAWHASDCVLDLEHPETRAGYLYRLAVRLGCPKEVAAEGVVAHIDRPGPSWHEPHRAPPLYLLIGAGRPYRARSEHDTNEPHSWWKGIKVETEDVLLALARAWPEEE